MNDDELSTAVKESVTGVHMNIPAEQIVRRSRAIRARRRIPGAASAALAAGLAVALTLTSGTARPPGAGASPAFAPASTATAVLRNAALAALAEPAATPQPGQFVYSKVYYAMTRGPKQSVYGGGWGVTGSSNQGVHGGSWPAVSQGWRSISGTRGGLFSQKSVHQPGTATGPEPACINDRVFPADRAGPHHCTPDDFAAYLPGMPTRPAALRAWLDGRSHVRPGRAGVKYLLAITQGILFTGYLTPAQHAAMYELLAQTPGLKTVPKAATVLGRTGVGVRWTSRTGVINDQSFTTTFTLVFNRKTYQVLGMNWTAPGGVTGGEALIKLAIVNKAGQLP